MGSMFNDEQQRINSIDEQSFNEVIDAFCEDTVRETSENFAVKTSWTTAASYNASLFVPFVLCIRFLGQYKREGNTVTVIIICITLVCLVAACVYANVMKGTVRARVNGRSIRIGGKSYDCGQIDRVYGAPSRNVEIYSGGRRILRVSMKDENCGALVSWARRNGINTELGDLYSEPKDSTKIILAVIGALVFIALMVIAVIYALSA